MGDSKEMEQGGTAVRALAAAAATGAATYAVRKALATRNGHDDETADEYEEDDEVSAKRKASDVGDEADDSEDSEDEDAEEFEGSAEDDEAADEEREEEDDDEDDVPENSADEGDEEDEEDDPDESNGAGGSSGKGSLRQLVDPSRLGGLTHLLVPLAGEAADSAGRYVAEHTSDAVQEQVVNRFIDAFEKAS